MPLGEPTTSTTSTSPLRGCPRPCPIITGRRQDLVDLTGGTVVDMAAHLSTADLPTAMATVGGHQGVSLGRHKGRRGGRVWRVVCALDRCRCRGFAKTEKRRKWVRDNGRLCNGVVGEECASRAGERRGDVGRARKHARHRRGKQHNL
jgi:hypothetical protein